MNHHTGRLLVACLAAAPLPGCATDPGTPVPASVRSAAAIESAFDRLAALGELEAFDASNDDHSETVALLDPGLPVPIPTGSEVYRRATRTLDALLEAFPVPTPAGDLPVPSAEDKAKAVKLYARARLATQSGDPAAGAALLDEALQFDPGAPALWRELGEAKQELGEREASVEAFGVAAELGIEDPRVFLLLASNSASRGDADEVIRWSGALWRLGGSSSDRAIAGAMLGSALIDRGNLRAGADALGAALETLRALPPAAGEPAELMRLRSRVPDLVARAGDAWAALGEPAHAEQIYAMVAERPGAPTALVQRLLAVRVASGRPAQAAIFLHDHIRDHAGDLGPEESRWLRALSGVDRVGPALLEATGEIARDPARPPSARAAVLRALVRGEPKPENAFERFVNAGAIARSPVIAGDTLWRFGQTDRVERSLDAIRRDRSLTRSTGSALVRLVPEPLGLARTLSGSEDPAERALALAMALELRRPHAARPVLMSGPSDDRNSLVDPTIAAELCGHAGMWSEGDAWLDAARADAGVSRARLIGALIACQRLAEAGSLASAIDGDPGTSAEELLAAAEHAFVTGDAESFASRIGRAAEIDPYDERVWEHRITLATSTAEEDDNEQLRATGRELAERRPRSALFGLLRARDLGSQGRMEDAASLIMSIGEREPSRDLGLSLLAQAASFAHTRQPGSGVVDRVSEWLRIRSESVPGSAAGLIALAEVRAITDPGEGVELLDAASERVGNPEIARAAERILRDRLDALDAASRRVLSRTEGNAGVDAQIERAEASNMLGDRAATAAALRAALPPRGSLTEGQRQRWQVALLTLAQTTDGVGMDESVADAVLSLLDEAGARGMPIPDPLLRARVVLLARLGRTEALVSMVEADGLGRDSGLLVVQALLASSQRDAGLDLLARLAVGNSEAPIDTELLDEWARLIGAGGDAERIRALLALLETPERVKAAAEALRERYGLARTPGSEGEARDRADIAYTGALLATVFDRSDASEGMYRLCLEIDPDHAWACNDLGYALADRGESLVEAERLAARAHALLGGEASVTDTLAWARYKLGLLEDEVDAEGRVIRAGAVTLLTQASLLEDGAGNATIFWHLGDALWRLGRRDEAIEAWSTAESMLTSDALDIASQENPNPRRREHITESLSEVRGRLVSVKSDAEPATASIPSLDGRSGDGARNRVAEPAEPSEP